MGRIGRWIWVVVPLLILGLWPGGCGQNVNRSRVPPGTPPIRVLLHQEQQGLTLRATEPPTVGVTGAAATPLSLPKNTDVFVQRTPSGWVVGNAPFGTGELTITPASDGSVRVNGQAHRGRYRLVPVANGRFDVVNDLDVESYLRSVVSKELLWNWHDEAYNAQAIVARTYALYECRMAGRRRHWDVYPDTRSQVYGGMAAETASSNRAIDATAGVVVAHGPRGRERIFKAYFSSCCGGITQSATDAFGDAPTPPLSDQNVGVRCNASPRFNWGPVVVPKSELARRFRAWGTDRDRPEKSIPLVTSITVDAVNRFGRPVRFLVTDSRGWRYSLSGEELRWAVNTDAKPAGTTLYSSFVKPVSEADVIRFVDGHGWGHAVGMCQWCAQQQAVSGVPHESIVTGAYPGSTLVRAY